MVNGRCKIEKKIKKTNNINGAKKSQKTLNYEGSTKR